MLILNKYIDPKSIIRILLSIAIIGIVLILTSVNRINKILSTELGFNKDSLITFRMKDVTVNLADSLVYSSNIPGIHINKTIKIKSKDKNLKFTHQLISENYLEFFKYEKLIDCSTLNANERGAKYIYINESALKKLGINDPKNAIGIKLLSGDYKELIIRGVVKDYSYLCLRFKKPAIIYELRNEKLAFAFYNLKDQDLSKIEKYSNLDFISFQERLQNRFRVIGDLIYSIFLIVNAIILIVGIGYIGNKYAYKREKELFKILGVGLNIITLIVSKTYIYIIVIVGFVAGPIAFLIQKFWLEFYEFRIQFGLIDLFIIFSILLLTLYVVFYPKKELNEQLKKKLIQID